MRFKRTPTVLLAGFLLTMLAAVSASAQSVYWKKDYLTDETGRVIATATPLPADQVAPSAPSGLTYTIVNLTAAQLQWNPSTDTGGSELAGYKVYRGNLPVAAVTGTSFTDNDLQPNTGYTYTVAAFDKAQNHSAPSGSVSFTTPDPNSVAAPSGLTATKVSSSQINLSWTDNSWNETVFKIERKVGEGGIWSQIATTGANTASHADTGLPNGTVYYYRVRASNGANDSGYSNEANACTGVISGTVDGKSSNIVYTGTGWFNDNDSYPEAYAGTQNYSATAGDKATFSFSGDSVTWLHLRFPHMGIANITIDGINRGNVDQYNSTGLWQQPTTYSGLGSGNHTITITVTGTKNASSTGYYVDVDAFLVP